MGERTVSGQYDADTFYLKDQDEPIRVVGVEAPELKNTVFEDGERKQVSNPAGEVSTAKAKAFLPKGSKVEVEPQSRDQFGRVIGDPTLKLEDVDVDYKLVLMDQNAAVYSTKYRDSDIRDGRQLAQFMSSTAPHEVGASMVGLDEETYNNITQQRLAVNATRDKVIEDPTPSNQQALDKLTAQLYGRDSDKLERWHFMNHPSSAKDEEGNYVMQPDNWMMEYQNLIIYNQRMAGAGGGIVPPDEEQTDEQKSVFGALYSKFSTIENIERMSEITNMNKYKELDFDVPVQEKLAGVKPEHHNLVLSQNTNKAALMMKNQLLEAYENDQIIDNGGMGETFLAGVGVVALDPTTYLGGPLVGTSVKGVAWGAKTLAIAAKGQPAVEKFLLTKGGQALSKTNMWVTGSATGSSIAYAPNLFGDPTATLKSYALDVAVDTAFGGGIAGLGIANRSLTGTKLGDKLGIFNAEVAAATVRARDKYFSNIEEAAGKNVRAVKAAAPNKAAMRDAYWEEVQTRVSAARDDLDKIALEVVDEATDKGLTGQKFLDEVELETTKRSKEYINTIKREVYQEVGERNKAGEFADLPLQMTDETLERIREEMTPERIARLDPEDQKMMIKALDLDPETIPNPHKVFLDDLEKSGATKANHEVLKSPTLTGQVGKAVGAIARSISNHMRKSDNAGVSYIGANVTELPEGMGGNAIRKVTGGLIKDMKLDLYMTDVMPGYERMINEVGISKGHGQWKRFKAMEDVAGSNPLIKETSRDILLLLNARRRGKDIKVHPAIKKFVDENWTKFTNRVHEDLVDAKIAGFRSNNKLNHYAQHTYTPSNIQAQIDKHGRETIVKAMQRGIRNVLQEQGKDIDAKEIRSIAEGRLNTWLGLDDSVDQFMPGIESSARRRLDMDLSATEGDFTLVDLVDQDIALQAEKLGHRASGLVGFSKSTDGRINSAIAWDDFRVETLNRSQKGNSAKDTQYMDDVYNMMMGRPTRGGLPSSLRSLRDMAVVTQMGNLGLNEFMESGLTIAKSVMSIARQPEITGQLYKMSRGGKKTPQLLSDVQALTGLTDSMDQLERFGSHLDVANPADTKIGRGLDTAAHYMTGGDLLPSAKRLLNRTTGFNMIRRFKYRVAQSSFALDLAKRFSNKGLKAVTSDARMKDLGVDGSIAKIFRDPNLVVYAPDGNLQSIRVDRLTNEQATKLGAILYRAASQDVQKHIVGELPAYLNNPIFNVALQYMSFPLVATNKQLARNAQFADIEALTGMMLNLMVTGLTQEAMVATGLRKEEDFAENTYKYYSSLGILPDITLLAQSSMNSDDPTITGAFQRIPIYSVLENYYDAAKEGTNYVLSGGQDEVDLGPVKSLIYLNNHATFKAMMNIYENEITKDVVVDE